MPKVTVRRGQSWDGNLGQCESQVCALSALSLWGVDTHTHIPLGHLLWELPQLSAGEFGEAKCSSHIECLSCLHRQGGKKRQKRTGGKGRNEAAAPRISFNDVRCTYCVPSRVSSPLGRSRQLPEASSVPLCEVRTWAELSTRQSPGCTCPTASCNFTTVKVSQLLRGPGRDGKPAGLLSPPCTPVPITEQRGHRGRGGRSRAPRASRDLSQVVVPAFTRRLLIYLARPRLALLTSLPSAALRELETTFLIVLSLHTPSRVIIFGTDILT